MSSRNTDSVHDGHRDRLKMRYLAEGFDNFELHNVLELLLFFGIPRIDTNEIAHNIINTFGSFSDALNAPYDQLIKVKGMTKSAAILMTMIPQLSRLYMLNQTADKEFLDSSKKIGEYFINRFIGRSQECVYMLFLDSSCSIIACDILAHGTVTKANISIRKVIDLVVKYNACRVVLAHNHPRGLASVSNEDVVMTKYMHGVLKPLDIELLDHIIVAQNSYVSVAELGYLRQ